MMKFKIKVQYLQRVFRSSHEDERQAFVQAARLAVLYDDFQLELEGVLQDKIPSLDGNNAEARRLYFLRRHSLTFHEIGSAIRVLNANPFFLHLRKSMNPEYGEGWDRAVVFFETNHKRLARLRNELGGHVQAKSIDFAISNLKPRAVGAIELFRRGEGADIRLKFAHELVATAMAKNRSEGLEDEQFFRQLFEFMLTTMGEVIRASHILFNELFWNRF